MENSNKSSEKVEARMINSKNTEIRQDNKKHLELVDKIRKEASEK